MNITPGKPLSAIALVTSGLLTFAGAHAESERAQDRPSPPAASAQQTQHPGTAERTAEAGKTMDADDMEDMNEDAAEAQQQVTGALNVVNKMKADPQLTQWLQRAQGVFIVPKFGQGAALVGARGGEGVLLVRQADDWSSPAFYDFGALSVGPQAGAAGGAIAMLLMNEGAVKAFRTDDSKFSLDANAGLTIMDYSAMAQGSAGKGDVVVWSDTQGLFAGASIAVSGIVRDDEENHAYYRQRVSAEQLMSGAVTNPNAQALQRALPDRVAAK